LKSIEQMEWNMPYLIRTGAAAVAASCVLALGAPAVRAQAQTPDAPATRANSPADAALADRVSAALEAEPHHLYRHVTVTVTNGVVRLGGLAYSNDAVEHAKEIASNTPGVSRVENQIQLERQGPNAPGH
jgi:osmotically-inducible protein OsmY